MITGKVTAADATSCRSQLISHWLRNNAKPTAIVKLSVDLR